MGFAVGNECAKNRKVRKGGPKPLATRELCHVEFHERVPALSKIIDSSESRDCDKIAAMRELGRIGVPERKELTGADGGPIESKVSHEHTIDYDDLRRRLDRAALEDRARNGAAKPVDSRIADPAAT